MKKIIDIYSSDGTLLVRSSNNEVMIISIDPTDDYIKNTITVNEDTIIELQKMIEELLQSKNKRDW